MLHIPYTDLHTTDWLEAEVQSAVGLALDDFKTLINLFEKTLHQISTSPQPASTHVLVCSLCASDLF